MQSVFPPAALALLCLAATPVDGTQPPVPAAAGTPLLLPVRPACISSPFGARGVVGPHASRMHNGIDLPAPAGTWVTAAAAGRVVAVRRLGASGLEVDIASGTAGQGAYVARYAHLGSVAPAIANGRATVAAGERVGRVGRTGITYGTHLHFEIRSGGQPVDPAPWLGVRPC
ncbi:M23 family metallopeptidase [Rhodovastum atsumiense]|uniref:M23 family metallopeptidase n=1 Tax=Rhodovastum atsumiense TaxID=504468 RepID=A0A5M6IQM5_9PROT|nr:M23 family metallopeptidase [Rhodovastum atsumiense]KAA5610576.1 M23 family metallopeptidase [Rhodovastum atsumiense]CAH2600687.1 M23 family metallopeptidase [Rhodovastum atsumiense]